MKIQFQPYGKHTLSTAETKLSMLYMERGSMLIIVRIMQNRYIEFVVKIQSL